MNGDTKVFISMCIWGWLSAKLGLSLMTRPILTILSMLLFSGIVIAIFK